MASLFNTQINNTYEGLIKTDGNTAIGAGQINLTDGVGNLTGLSINNTLKEFKYTQSAQVNNTLQNSSFAKGSYPMSATAGHFTSLNFKDGAGLDTGYFIQDRYGSIEYQNIYGDQGETHFFTSKNGAGAYVPAKIAMDTWDGVNNSSNWYLGYQRSVDALSYDSGTGLLTLGRTAAADLTVTISGGGGSAGLVAGTGLNSMNNAATLANGSNASGENSIALGNGATASGLNTVAFGQGANASAQNGVCLGQGTIASGVNALAIGQGATAEYDRAVSIGDGITSQNGANLTIGAGNTNLGAGATIIGLYNTIGLNNQQNVLISSNLNIPTGQNDYVSIGRVNNPVGTFSNSIQIGLVSTMTNSTNSVVIGRSSSAVGANDSVAIGRGASVTVGQSAAIGYNVVGSRSGFVAVNQLELKTVGGGIILPSPNGTLYKITVDDAGALVVTAV